MFKYLPPLNEHNLPYPDTIHPIVVHFVIAMVLFARSTGKSAYEVLDFVAPLCPIGLGAGRIGNFINGELWGRVTDVPWAMIFPGDPAGLPRHPSQLYQFALEGVVLFLILRFGMTTLQIHKRPGSVIAWFLLFYGLFRFAVEFFRDSESMIYGWFSMGQLLSLPMWAAAAYFLWYAAQRPAKAA